VKITVREPGFLLDCLLQMMQTTKKTTARQMLKHGGVIIDGAVEKRANRPVRPGEVIEINRVDQPAVELLGLGKGPLQIYHEDEAIILVQKPVGLLSTNTDKARGKSLHGLLSDYVKGRGGGRVYVVHRLERNTSGLMVFAKTHQAKVALASRWEKTIARYVALVVGKPRQAAGRIEKPLAGELAKKGTGAGSPPPRTEPAVTAYTTRKSNDGFTLLDIEPVTKHRRQILEHLAGMGCPVVGDRDHGAGIQGRPEIMLFCYYLRFAHPETGKLITFKIPTPNWRPPNPKRTVPFRSPKRR